MIHSLKPPHEDKHEIYMHYFCFLLHPTNNFLKLVKGIFIVYEKGTEEVHRSDSFIRNIPGNSYKK